MEWGWLLMNILQELYRIYENECPYDATKESWNKCKATLNAVPEEPLESIVNAIHAYAGDLEKLGFINGFSYGVRLMAECLLEGGASNN